MKNWQEFALSPFATLGFSFAILKISSRFHTIRYKINKQQTFSFNYKCRLGTMPFNRRKKVVAANLRNPSSFRHDAL